MFGMKGLHVSASGAIQGHHGPLVLISYTYPCFTAPLGLLNGERVGLMTWWLRVRSPFEANCVFLPLSSAKACEKRSWWLWREKLCYYWCEKVCITYRHDMTLAVKVKPQPIKGVSFPFLCTTFQSAGLLSHLLSLNLSKTTQV